jgi:hypothetical protein
MATLYAKTGTAMNWSASTWGVLVTGAAWDNTTYTLTPASSPGWGVNALAGLTVEVRNNTGTAYLLTIVSNTASLLICSSGGPTTTANAARWILFNQGPPATNDTANLNGAVVAWDGAQTTIPASGALTALNSLTSAPTPANSAGQLTLAMSGTTQYALNVTTITGGSVGGGGFVRVTGSVSGAKLTITGTDLIAGSGGTFGIFSNSTGAIEVYGNVTAVGSGGGIWNDNTGALTVHGNVTAGSAGAGAGIDNNSTATVTVIGIITGGSNDAAYGLLNNSNGALNITGDVVGGAGIFSIGVRTNGNGTSTMNGGNLINGTGGTAWAGKPPVWNITGHANYEQWPTVNLDGGGNAVVKFPVLLAQNLVKLSTVIYSGYLGTRKDCPVAQALTTSGYYGDYLASELVGTATLPSADNVISTAPPYGVGSATYGNYYVLGASDIRYNVPFGVGGADTGLLQSPLPANVLYNVGYGANGEYTGNLYLPSTDGTGGTVHASLVLSTAHFGVGNATAGTATGGGIDPANIVSADYVLTGHNNYVGGSAGTLTLPSADDLIVGASCGINGTSISGNYLTVSGNYITYGTAFGVSGASTGTVVVPGESYVLYGTAYGAGSGMHGNVTLPNTDGHTPDASQVLTSAHFGASNATQGTATGGGGSGWYAGE